MRQQKIKLKFILSISGYYKYEKVGKCLLQYCNLELNVVVAAVVLDK